MASLLDIVLYPDDVLKTTCTPVDVVDDQVRQLVDNMVETMYAAPGIGLAAPQVNDTRRITVIDVSSREEGADSELITLINPQIVHRQGKIVWEEGCLSIPGVYDKVTRAETIVVQALDRDGSPFELEASELLAVCIQHEVDHLDGVLMLDHFSHLKRKLALKRYKKHLEALEEQKQQQAEKDASPT
ncbi:peptide deformylase [Lujinxingia litoralis]|uniref:Peptide deformylase n=1 Tax=Lujinxingia litoralis TaxID=2211119 RepID=A0A328C0S6_9DELT|nr:peptide deformylase [Lujinxingia litoralis]RAL20176.1 peptide deformylase [Lujinxingia litoralis]